MIIPPSSSRRLLLAVLILWGLFQQYATAQTAVKLAQEWILDESRFDDNVLSAVTPDSLTGTFIQPPLFAPTNSLEFNGRQYATTQIAIRDLPQRGFSVETWAKVDQPTRWGCLFGFQQDNGSYERGWSLGYNQNRFEFRAADNTKLINATSGEPFRLTHWHHIVGICDPAQAELRLYVDAQLASKVAFTADGVQYPEVSDGTQLVLGAYKDKDELFPLQGSIREIRLYHGIMSEKSIRASANKNPVTKTKGLEFAVRPGVRFLTTNSAEFRWETSLPGRAQLAVGLTRKPDQILESPALGTNHRVVVDDLVPGQDYWYRFASTTDGKRKFSRFYKLEGSMNYSMPILKGVASSTDRVDSLAKILRQPGGFAAVLDLPTSISESLASQTEMTVVAGCTEDLPLQSNRRGWYQKSIYGIRLTAQRTKDLPTETFNLVVCSSSNIPTARTLLCPLGALVVLGDRPSNGNWRQVSERHWIESPNAVKQLSQWGHQYGGVSNASFSGENLGGVDRTDNMEIRWLGRPGADFGIDRNPRMPAPLATGGRLFHQGMNRMIALDAFNGAVLWSLEIPDLRRVNIPRDCGNWCSDQTHVYAAVKDRLWVIDAATGRMLRTVMMPEAYRQEYDWGYVAVSGEQLFGTATVSSGGYQNFWDKPAWYDGKDDAATAKVCGRCLVCYDKKYGSVSWTYEADAIVHSSITLDEQHIYAIVVDDNKLPADETGKLVNSKIWPKASVVCLDRKTGKEKWKRKAPAQPHEAIISFGIATDGLFVLQTSGKNQFHFSAFDSNSGETNWQRSVDWPEDHHGAHMQHAVAMNGQLFVQPHILDAKSGRVLKSGTLGKRRGCATPIGAGGSIIYRGGSGPLSLWSIKDDSKTEFARLRPSCWLSTIPAQGMLFSPEGGGGCSCGGWMETSVGFAPKRTVETRDQP